jgi:hypothetical protein
MGKPWGHSEPDSSPDRQAGGPAEPTKLITTAERDGYPRMMFLLRRPATDREFAAIADAVDAGMQRGKFLVDEGISVYQVIDGRWVKLS